MDFDLDFCIKHTEHFGLNFLKELYWTPLTNNGWLKVHKHCTRDVFPSTGFTEEGVEWVVTSSDGLVRGHLPVWLNTMLQTVELPAGVPYLYTSLANVYRDTLTLQEEKMSD